VRLQDTVRGKQKIKLSHLVAVRGMMLRIFLRDGNLKRKFMERT